MTRSRPSVVPSRSEARSTTLVRYDDTARSYLLVPYDLRARFGTMARSVSVGSLRPTGTTPMQTARSARVAHSLTPARSPIRHTLTTWLALFLWRALDTRLAPLLRHTRLIGLAPS